MTARPVPAYGAAVERGTLLGDRYRLNTHVGAGGTADVFCGVDQVLGREVAIKVFRADSDTVTADRFCDEARVLAGLSHRALVTVYDAGRHGQGAFMVTELIRGVTLRTRIDAGPLSLVQATRLGAEIASALDHVHAHGIVHHDVKPSNILLSEDGSPYLADFGLSRAVRDPSHRDPDTLVGTLAYMAPEQFLGHGASTASDVYALGVTLLEALTGHREYQGTPVEVGTAHLLRSPRIPETLPAELGRLLEAMTDQDPKLRPDAARVHLRLHDIVNAPPTRAAGPAACADASTHRSPVPFPGTAAFPVVQPVPSSVEADSGRPARRRAAVTSLVAASAVGIGVLLMGGIPTGESKPSSSPSRHQPSASKEAEAAGPGGTASAPPTSIPSSAVPSLSAPSLPARSASETPDPPVTTAAAARELPASASLTDSRSRHLGADHPVKAPKSAPPKDDAPQEAKGKKDKKGKGH